MLLLLEIFRLKNPSERTKTLVHCLSMVLRDRRVTIASLTASNNTNKLANVPFLNSGCRESEQACVLLLSRYYPPIGQLHESKTMSACIIQHGAEASSS